MGAIFRPPRGSDAAALHRIAETYYRTRWETVPQEAAALGLREYRGRLGANGPDTHRAHATLLRETLEEVEALPAYYGDDWTDRRAFLSALRTALYHQETHPHWRINPQTHSGAAVDGIFHLVVRHAGDLRAVAPDIVGLAADVPRFLDEGFSCLRRPVPLWTRLALRSSSHAAEFIEGLAPQIAALAPSPASARRTFAAAAEALRDYGRRLGKIRTGASFAVGRQAFEFLLREKMGSDATANELWHEGRRLVAALSAELDVEARRFGRKGAGVFLARLREEWRPSEATLLSSYRRATTEIKNGVRRTGIVSLPRGERLEVVPVPDFLREQFPTAAYSAPGPFDQDQTGLFWVNDLGKNARGAAREAEIAQHFGLELTCAHEAYPGHHLQFILQNRHPSRLRRMFSHAVFYEGWTLWCEKLCVEKKIYRAPHARLVRLHDALWRAHRILVDIGLQTRGLTHAAATKHLVDNVGFTRARAAADVNWYTAAPTVPMSYLLGLKQVEALRAERGGSLRQFNDWLLSHGAVPFSWFRGN